ncbi:MAG: 3-oxoacyl-ACP synthase [Okeania sp. SIO3C4]|nr:3-oxoacyl-ACP synthase [Okeania sp. SIO3C4]
MKDLEIDYSDIPETDEEFWADAEVYESTKRVEYTMKLDEDIANWLEELDSNSEHSINLILRSYMLTTQQLKPLA